MLRKTSLSFAAIQCPGQMTVSGEKCSVIGRHFYSAKGSIGVFNKSRM